MDRVSVIRDTRQREDDNGETVMESVVSSCAVDETVFDPPQNYRVISEYLHRVIECMEYKCQQKTVLVCMSMREVFHCLYSAINRR